YLNEAVHVRCETVHSTNEGIESSTDHAHAKFSIHKSIRDFCFKLLNKSIDKVLVIFLFAAYHFRFAVGMSKVSQVFQRELSLRESLPFSCIERRIAVLSQLLVFAIVEDRLGREKRSCKHIHSPDMSMKNIHEVCRVATGFRIEIHAA